MPLDAVIEATAPAAVPASASPHYTAFETTRTVANDPIYEWWKGPLSDPANRVGYLDKDGDLTLSGGVTGTTATLSGAATIGGTLGVTGVATLTGGAKLGAGADILANYVAPAAWTPVLATDSVSGSHTYAVQLGRYLRIGMQVHFWAVIELSAKDAAMAGTVILSGLPIAAATVSGGNLYAPVTLIHSNVNLDASYTNLAADLRFDGSTQLVFRQLGDNVGMGVLSAAAIGNTSRFEISGTYFAA